MSQHPNSNSPRRALQLPGYVHEGGRLGDEVLDGRHSIQGVSETQSHTPVTASRVCPLHERATNRRQTVPDERRSISSLLMGGKQFQMGVAAVRVCSFTKVERGRQQSQTGVTAFQGGGKWETTGPDAHHTSRSPPQSQTGVAASSVPRNVGDISPGALVLMVSNQAASSWCKVALKTMLCQCRLDVF